MEGVKRSEQLDDTTLDWVADVAGKEKTWRARITEQTPDQRIAWTSTEGAHNAGVVTFHRLGRRREPGHAPAGRGAGGADRERRRRPRPRRASGEGRHGAVQGVHRVARPGDRRVARRGRPDGRLTRRRAGTIARVCQLRCNERWRVVESDAMADGAIRFESCRRSTSTAPPPSTPTRPIVLPISSAPGIASSSSRLPGASRRKTSPAWAERLSALPSEPPRGSWYLTADPATCRDRQPGLRTILIGPAAAGPRPTRCDTTARDLRDAVWRSSPRTP